MVELLVRAAAGVILLLAVGGKLRAPRASRAGLANLGVPAWAWTGGLVAELAALGVVAAAPRVWLAAPAALFACFALVLGRALRQGAAGRPCGCFGARGTVTWPAVARNLGIGVALAAAAAWPSDGVGVDVTAVVLLVMGLAIVALGVAVLALAREIGVLRVAVGSTGRPLELDHEGPALGAHVDIGTWCDPGHDGFAVAVFTSAGCVMCQGLGPALTYLGQDPWLVVRTFDEEQDRTAWTAFAVPGSPYAVVLEPGGTVRAKGTFNGLPQLEGLVASAARRQQEEEESAHVR